jgi:hypothetical protein
MTNHAAIDLLRQILCYPRGAIGALLLLGYPSSGACFRSAAYQDARAELEAIARASLRNKPGGARWQLEGE